MRALSLAALILAALSLAACGGGGSSGSSGSGGSLPPPPPPPPTYLPPLIFIADKDTAGVNELYRADQSGALNTKLNAALVSGGNVIDAQWSPDGTKVAYLADQDTDETFELYVVASTGGTPLKLNAALPSGADVKSFAWAGSVAVCFIADANTAGVMNSSILTPPRPP